MIKTILNGVDVTLFVPFKTISMSDSLTIKSDSLSFTMYIKEFETPPPRSSQTVQVRYYFDTSDYPTDFLSAGVYDTAEILFDAAENKYYTVEFEGLITTVTRKWIAPPLWLSYECVCADYTRQFDRNLVNEVYPAGWYSGDIVIDIVNNYVSSDYNVFHVDRGVKVP